MYADKFAGEADDFPAVKVWRISRDKISIYPCMNEVTNLFSAAKDALDC